MFSAIPMPQFEWNEEVMRYMLCAFPAVGAVIGGCCWGWDGICRMMKMPQMLHALGLCLIPVLITGGIHLDGCCDTWDALASRGDREKMTQILKDPHIGSFAVIRLVCLMLSTFVLWTVLPAYPAAAVLFGFVLSRSLSALAVLTFPMTKRSSSAAYFAGSASRKPAVCICLVFALGAGAGMVFFGGWYMLPAALLVFVWYRTVIVPRFGGLSGDLAGWFLQTCEVWMLAALCLGSLVWR